MELTILIVALAILWPLTKLALGWWTYTDARARQVTPIPWTLVVILAPSLLGLFGYLLIGRRHAKRDCPACHAAVPRTAAVCPACGATLSPVLTPAAERKPLVWVGVLVLLMLSFSLHTTVDAVRDPAVLADANIALCPLQVSAPGDWRVTFWYLNGAQTQHLTRTASAPRLHVSGTLAKGRARLVVKTGTRRVATLALDGRHTVDLARYPVGTRLTLELQAHAAQGELHAHW